VVFLLADGTYNSCKIIPVYDETTSTKFPKDFEHECTINCSVENIDLSILDDTESESDNETARLSA
jgi:hypothetical protein